MKTIANFVSPTRSLTAIFILVGLALPVMAGWSQRQKITSSPRGVGAQHGYAVAMSGNTMVVGAPLDGTTANQAGAAYVYVLSGGNWTQQTVLLAFDGALADKFGYSVAISENTIVVGAFNDDSPLSNAGSAYVFVRSGTTWAFQQKLAANDAAASDEFGNAVAITGEVVVVGSHFADYPGNSDAGAAYVFVRTGTNWAQTQKLTPTPGQVGPIFGDHMGESVAIGSKIAVGAPGDDSPQTAAGAVYVFAEGAGGYALQQKLTIPSGRNGDDFGNSVAIEGNTLVGGASEYTPINGQPAFGAAYPFEFNGANWISQGQLVAADGASFDRFGWSVAVSNNVIAAGARDDVTAAGINAGSAYVFTRSGTTWTQQEKLDPTDTATGDRFGSAVALSFGNLIVGAAEKALTAPNGQGAAYYFTLGGVARFDYDGDGKSDISVFRPSSGAWYLLRSQAGLLGVGWGSATDKIAPADYDGDGRTDIAVYRPSSGVWYVLNSSNSTVSYVTFGIAEDLPIPGDYDGDGRADVSVFRPSTGAWYRLNSSNGALVQYQFGANGDKPLLGDFDGDHKSDIAVYRPSTGSWYRINSSDGSFHAEQFGNSTDLTVPADYDGDSKTDLAVFRPSTGAWYRLNSGDGSFSSIQFGVNGDIPAPGDFDGDGQADISLFRPTGGNWFQLNSSNGALLIQQFGASGDVPTPAAYSY